MSVFEQRTSPFLRGASFAGAALRRYGRRLVAWRTERALKQLSDHMLRDIGLTREDIESGLYERMERDRP
jgi:uncharacterized protein YjiS (DUF1127 family)